MAQTASILLQSAFATAIYNLDSTRFHKASLDNRTEGWTETWGENHCTRDGETIEKVTSTNGKEKQNMKPACWEAESNSVSLPLATPHPQLPLVLTQHRPAWLEQMVLRMAKIPYIVVNSTHISNEATGQMPFLTDYHDKAPIASASGARGDHDSKHPILVGRCHPTNLTTPFDVNQNSILLYLAEYRKADLDADALTTQQQRGLSNAFLSLIQTELASCVLYLRFEDQDAWEQVYRKQYIQASFSSETPMPDENTSWIVQVRGRFQASMERAVERRRLLEYSRGQSIERVKERAKKAYESIERQLIAVASSSSRDQRRFLLGTERPAFVDAALWAHLADGFCDLHLVVILASFPLLIQYFQDLYKAYFALHGKVFVDTWEVWNERQNVSNAFQKIPILRQATRMAEKSSAFMDAIDLMQSLSLQKQELYEVLGAVKAKRESEAWPTHVTQTETLLYRWRMGEDFEKRQSVPEKEENPLRKKLLRDQIRNDQMWISGTASVTIVALLLLQAGAAGPDS